MQTKIPEKTIDDVRFRTDIVEVISGYLSLKRAGQNFKGLCPFHSEKTPSFMVSPSKQIFHCFGCHAGGNVFSFIMKIDNATFTEAVIMLAKKVGISISFENNNIANEKEKLYTIMEQATEFYHECLLDEALAKNARQYLEKRGFTQEIIKLFKLGYAPLRSNHFIQRMIKSGVTIDMLSQVGLVKKDNKKNESYSWFRNRIIFPIFDLSNRVIAFGARAIGNEMPKYINSPDSPLFSKSNILYGLNLSKRDIVQEKKAILVEGYIDFIRLFSSGIKHGVATLGTAFTESHARILHRYSPEIVVAFDSDSAGTHASLRAFDVFLEKGLQARIAVMPPGEDPDSFIAKKGSDSFRDLLTTAPLVLDYKLEVLLHVYDLKTEQGKNMIAKEMSSTIMKLESAISKEYYLKKLSQTIGISESALYEEYMKREKKHERRNYTSASDTTSAPKGSLDSKRERMLLEILLNDTSKASIIFNELDEVDFFDEHLRRIFNLVKHTITTKKGAIAHIVDAIDDPQLQSVVSQMVFSHSELASSDQALHETIRAIKKNTITKEMNYMIKDIRQREAEGNDVIPLLKKMQEMRKTIASLQ
ncbi:DNA primase [Chlamydiota bacterium]